MSADKYNSPDNHYGYGLPNMILAAGFGLKIMPVGPITISIFKDTSIIFTTLAPTTEPVVFQSIDLPPQAVFVDHGDGTAGLSFFLQKVGGGTYRVAAQAGSYADTLTFIITGTGSGDEVSVGPNPFSDSLRVYFGGEAPGAHHIEIFSLSGELIYDYFGAENPIVWPGTNAAGEEAAAGVYIIWVSADGMEKKVKVFKI
jgi:hypothetical protein